MKPSLTLTFDTSSLSRSTAAEFRLMADAIDEASAKRRRGAGVVKSTSGVVGHTTATTLRDYSRSLCATAERVVMHYRGSGDHLAPEEMRALVIFLRGRLAAWEETRDGAHFGAHYSYDHAINQVCRTALAMHDDYEATP